MKEEIKIALENIAIAVEQYKGTKAEHIALERYVQLIREELTACKCKQEVKELVKDGTE